MSRAEEHRAFGEYCARAVGRHSTWAALLADIQAEAARASLELTEGRVKTVLRWHLAQSRHRATKRSMRNGLKRKRRIERWSTR